MRNRTMLRLLFVFGLAFGLALSGCAKRQMTRSETDRLDTLTSKIAQAEATGAKTIAPRELAEAKVAVDHARHELSERFEDGLKALDDAEKAVDRLMEKMKPHMAGSGGAGAGSAGAGGGAGTGTGSGGTTGGGTGTSQEPYKGSGSGGLTAVDNGATAPEGLADKKLPPFRPKPVPVEQGNEGSFENIHFDFDESVIREDARPILMTVGEYMRNNRPAKLQVEGHCDERGTSEYNMALGQRRAESTKKYLVNLGIAQERVTTISFGKERPLDPAHEENAWARNRRGVFILLQK